MRNTQELLQITHVNIRLSISLLLSKLIFVELIAAFLVILFHSSLFLLDIDALRNLQSELFSIPLFVILVTIKTAITFSIILQWLNEYYEITPDVIYHRKGLFFKTEERYPLEDIAQIEVQQGVVGRIWNFGTIILTDTWRHTIIEMNYIHNPRRYSNVLKELAPKAGVIKRIIREGIWEKNIFDDKEK